MSCACAMEPRHQLRLVNIIKHNKETYSLDFEPSDIPVWEEGDSSKIFLSVGGAEMGKAFSYATLPEEGVIRFTTRIKSERSDYKEVLSKVAIGESIEVTQPKGDFKIRRDNRPIVLLSNGVGIAAIRSIVKAYEKDQTAVPELIQLNVDASGFIYEDEFEAIVAQNIGFKSMYTSGRQSFQPALRECVIDLWNRSEARPYYYVVGSENFVRDTVNFLYEAGFTDEDVIMDASGCGCSSGGGCGCGSKKVVSILSAIA